MTTRKPRGVPRDEWKLACILAESAEICMKENHQSAPCAPTQLFAWCSVACDQDFTGPELCDFEPAMTIDLTTAPGAHWLCRNSGYRGTVAPCWEERCKRRVRFVAGKVGAV